MKQFRQKTGDGTVTDDRAEQFLSVPIHGKRTELDEVESSSMDHGVPDRRKSEWTLRYVYAFQGKESGRSLDSPEYSNAQYGSYSKMQSVLRYYALRCFDAVHRKQ